MNICLNSYVLIVNYYLLGDGEDTEETMERSNNAVTANTEEHGEQSHLIVWQVQCPLPVPMNGKK